MDWIAWVWAACNVAGNGILILWLMWPWKKKIRINIEEINHNTEYMRKLDENAMYYSNEVRTVNQRFQMIVDALQAVEKQMNIMTGKMEIIRSLQKIPKEEDNQDEKVNTDINDSRDTGSADTSDSAAGSGRIQ